MRIFRHWSIRYKLMGLLVLLGLVTLAVTGTVAYLKDYRSIERDVMNQLTGVTRTRRAQIETYYRNIHSYVETLSEDRTFIEAMRDFGNAYQKMNNAPVSAVVLDAVREDYRLNFYPVMQRLGIARQGYQNYLPVTPAAIQLQYLYIVKNPYHKGHRDELADAGDGSEYSKVHANYHAAFVDLIRTFGYFDLYLVDDETGSVVYDVSKDRDFGTNLREGSYANSHLAAVVKKCMETNNPKDVFFSDFESYDASMGEPTQYVASPIFDGKKRLGVLAFQLSAEAINNVMTGSRGWERDGLGKTGEALLVGADHLARSDVRQYLEGPEKYLASQKAAGVPEETLNRIRTFKTTILQMPINHPSVNLALDGLQGTRIGWNGIETSMVSYTPVDIEGLHWALIARISTAEALLPIREMRLVFSWWGVGLLALTVLAAWLAAYEILRPVNALVGAAKRVAAGNLEARVDWKSTDELGELSDTFNSMIQSIRESTELIREKNRENEALLLNILPAEIAARLKSGEHEIADSFADVTVLFGDIVGFTALSSRTTAGEVVELLNGLFSQFDELAQELEIEKIKTIGDCYMAVCGLPRPCADHTERMARMALRMADITQRYGKKMDSNLQLRIGLNTGPVVAGVIGETKFIYDLWGDTVNLASRMESTGVPGAIQVTRSVYERLKDNYDLESRGLVAVKGKGQIETWLLHGQSKPAAVASIKFNVASG
jgi:class 3 adenylate cyclase